jgi:hypothetical protein
LVLPCVYTRVLFARRHHLRAKHPRGLLAQPWPTPGQSFLLGTDGCVSIANCLRYDNFTECRTPHTKVDDDDSGDHWRRVETFFTVVIVGLVLIVIGVTCACCRRKQKKDNSPMARLVDEHEVAALDDTAAPAYVVVHPA